MTSTVRLLCGALAAAALTQGLAPAPAIAETRANAPEPNRMVNCLDIARQIVVTRPAAACSGRIVSDDEARRVRNRRIELLRSKMSGRKPPLVPDRRIAGLGTGFIVSQEGHVVTNWHVVEGCAAVSIEPVGRDPALADVVAGDAGLDLAILRAEIDVSQIARFRPVAFVDVGEPISIVGYPLHGMVAIKPIYRDGRVIRPMVGAGRLGPRYQLKVDVRRGNSGGPVLDSSGLVIGVISAKVHTPSVYRMTGKLIRDVGLAIRPGAIMSFLERHDVPFIRGAVASKRSSEEVFDDARGYVTRVVCWR